MSTVRLDSRALADLEMLATSAFAPLRGFLTRKDYTSVINRMRLASGEVWTMPIVLGVSREEAESLKIGQPVGLLENGKQIAILHLAEKFSVNKVREAKKVYGTTDRAHPGVAALMARGDVLLGGRIQVIRLPEHNDFARYRLSPAQARRQMAARGWRTVVGFQTRNPIHRAHEYLTKTALELVDGLLLHPLVGATKSDDIPAAVRMRSYEALVKNYYPSGRVLLAVNPGNMYYAGPREAIHHALIRKNYGCTHFIVGRDHAGVGSYYGPFDAQKLFGAFTFKELGITPFFFDNSFYCRSCEGMATSKTCPHPGTRRVTLSGSQVRALIQKKKLRRASIPARKWLKYY